MRKMKSSGQSLVEFALVLPLFMLVAIFIFDMGRVVFIYTSMSNAVREGARIGSVGCISSNVNSVVNQMVPFELVNVESNCFDKDEDGLNIVKVEANYYFVAATPLIQNLFLDDQIIIHTESTMHLEFTGIE